MTSGAVSIPPGNIGFTAEETIIGDPSDRSYRP